MAVSEKLVHDFASKLIEQRGPAAFLIAAEKAEAAYQLRNFVDARKWRMVGFQILEMRLGPGPEVKHV
jgi:hypothetical protein